MATPDHRRHARHIEAVAAAGSEANTVTATAIALKSGTTATILEGATQGFNGWALDGLMNWPTSATLTWDTSNHAFATVDGTGLVTAVAPGTCNLTATAHGHTATLAITIAPDNTPTSVILSPTSASKAHGGNTQQFTATVKNAAGRTLTTGGGAPLAALTWTSSDVTKATVDNTGLATTDATNTGAVTITATTLNSVAGTATLTVT